MKIERFLAIMAMGLLATVGARADAILSYQHMVTVGDAGNAADDTTYGSVAGVYQISKYEVTAGEYAAFLNAAAKSDPNGLYDGNMDSSAYGCQITRHGDSGSYAYDFSGRPSGAVSDWENRPVNLVSWYDAARYCNWLTTSNTESGVYNTSTWAIDRGYRNAQGLAYFIPTEDEWYKAAYYKGGSTNAGYWGYPTGSDTAPTSEVPPGGANSANYNSSSAVSPYYRNNVGAYSSSVSAYGTFDQGGNLDEWNETLIGTERGVRGGAFDNGPAGNLQADSRDSDNPTRGAGYRGFRVASIATVSEFTQKHSTAFSLKYECDAVPAASGWATSHGDGTNAPSAADGVLRLSSDAAEFMTFDNSSWHLAPGEAYTMEIRCRTPSRGRMRLEVDDGNNDRRDILVVSTNAILWSVGGVSTPIGSCKGDDWNVLRFAAWTNGSQRLVQVWQNGKSIYGPTSETDYSFGSASTAFGDFWDTHETDILIDYIRMDKGTAWAPFLPCVVSVNAGQNSIAMSFSSASGVLYRAQSTTNLQSVAWLDVGTPVTGSSSTNTVTNSIISSREFFRIVEVTE